MKNLTYREAAALFKAADLPSSVRHVRTMIWNHPKLCPVQNHSYHNKTMREPDVQRLIKKLVAEVHSRKSYTGETMLHGTEAGRGKR